MVGADGRRVVYSSFLSSFSQISSPIAFGVVRRTMCEHNWRRSASFLRSWHDWSAWMRVMTGYLLLRASVRSS